MDDIVDINLSPQDYCEAEQHVHVQPIIQLKLEMSCICDSDEYWLREPWTCSTDYWNCRSYLPGDLVAEFWIKRGYLPDCLACAEDKGKPCTM